MSRARPEHQIQVSIIEFWNLRGRRDLDLFAIPNGGARDVVTASIMKREGVRPGVPDLCVILDGGKVGWIECKAPKGRLSEEQKEVARRWQAKDHLYATVRDLKDAQIVLALWGALRGGKEASE